MGSHTDAVRLRLDSFWPHHGLFAPPTADQASADSPDPSIQISKLRSLTQKFTLHPSKLLCPNSHADIVKVLSTQGFEAASDGFSREHVLQWLLLGEAGLQAYSSLLQNLIIAVDSFAAEISYWNAVIDSGRSTAIYLLQTSPIILWKNSSLLYHQFGYQTRRQGIMNDIWRELYRVVQNTVQSRSLNLIRSELADSVAAVRTHARSNKTELEKNRSKFCSAIGFLLINCFDFQRYFKPTCVPLVEGRM